MAITSMIIIYYADYQDKTLTLNKNSRSSPAL